MFQQEISIKKSLGSIKCNICKKEIKGNHRITKLAMNYAIICENCNDKFTSEELELISNIFTAFGGYFGQMEGDSKSVYHTIKRLSNMYQEVDKKIDLSAVDIKILHQALLHGISPSQIVQGLKLLVH
jgi:hypothetical protein